jgi:phage repressor protein C with HTH and peptisase S24 domain
MSQYLNGKIPLNVNAAIKFSSMLGCSIAEFSPTLGTQAATIAAAVAQDATLPESVLPFSDSLRVRVGEPADTVPIKRVNVRLQAGVMKLEPAYDETFGEDLHIPASVVRQLNIEPKNLRAFSVKGRSGEPMFFEDDLVVVDVTDIKPRTRELYAIAFDGEACIKQMLHRGGQWYLHSINPEFGPINAKSGELKIVGRVVYQPGRVVTGRL